jgi:hypothetical protein
MDHTKTNKGTCIKEAKGCYNSKRLLEGYHHTSSM